MTTFAGRAADVLKVVLSRWIIGLTLGVSVVLVLKAPELSQGTASAQAASVSVTGVQPNQSSGRVFYRPVAGAADYRVYDAADPTNVKYAGLSHLSAAPECPGSSCQAHFVAQSDGVTPVFPYQVASGPSGGPQVLDGPATDIEWNTLGDGQPHTLIVEAVSQLGPVPRANLYSVTDKTALASGGMLGSNKGPTSDGKVSTNGQGPYTNNPQVIARSQPFVVQARRDLQAIPSRASASQQFFDTFDNAENSALKLLGRQDSVTDGFGNLGQMSYSLNAGSARAWTIEYRQADNQNSMPFISSDHFMDMLFDGATPGTSAPMHTIYGSMAMDPNQTIDMSNGKVAHLTMEVDGHQSFRRWLAFDLAPASDPLQAWDASGHAINNSDQGLFVEVKDGGCTLDVFTGATSASNPSPTGTAGGSGHGARLWGGAGSVGGAPIMCGWSQMYDAGAFSKNGYGLDDRSRYDLFISQTHAALFQDGRLIVQSDIPAGSFPWANQPLKAYYTHYLYHSDADRGELLGFQVNGAGMCYPLNAYWFNDPVNGTAANQDFCNKSYPAGYGLPFSDERHWDNMGFEVLSGSDVPSNNDFSVYGTSVQAPPIQAPQFTSGVPENSLDVGGDTSLTAAADSSSAPTAIPTAAPKSIQSTVPDNLSGQWVNMSPAGVSVDQNNPPNNFGFNTVATDPTAAGTVYIGTNYQGIYKSTNHGDSWVKLDTGSGSNLIDTGRNWALVVDPFNHTTLYAASGYGAGGPLKSTDGGVSWTHLLPPGNATANQIGTNDINKVVLDPALANHLLVSFHYFWHNTQDAGVIESFDGGASWTIHNPPPGGGWGAGSAVFFLNNSQTWLVGTQGNGLWRTTNSGQTWTQVSTVNTGHGGSYALYRNASTGTLFIAGWNGPLKSTDNGASWQPFTTGVPYAYYTAVFGNGTQIFTAPSFPLGGDNTQAHGPWYVANETDTQWTAYNGQSPCSNNMCNGPEQMAVDSNDGTIYSANWNAGVFRLSTGVLGQPPAPASPTPLPAPPTMIPAPTDTTTVSPDDAPIEAGDSGGVGDLP